MVNRNRGRTSTTYHANGLPWTVASGGRTWTYGYNGRGLLESETMSSGTSTFSIGHAYNANGHEASLTYPDGSSVDFAPNGLGEPMKSGNYATGAHRHVNGALKAFSYGNGVYHDSTQTPHRGGAGCRRRSCGSCPPTAGSTCRGKCNRGLCVSNG